MSRIFAILILIILVLSFGAEAKMQEPAGNKILSNPCILSYTDAMGKSLRVIKSNALIVFLK